MQALSKEFTQRDQRLLNVSVGRNRSGCVALEYVPGPQGLQGSVSTSPAAVIELVLQIQARKPVQPS